VVLHEEVPALLVALARPEVLAAKVVSVVKEVSAKG
jgi:hypothetical protein